MGQIGEIEHLLEVAAGLLDAGPIGLVDDEHVGDLHQTGLVRLHTVAPARVDHDDGRVRLAGDLDLDLTDAHRLDEHPLAADRIEDAQAQGFKLTPLVFLIKAMVAALKKFPRFNASLDSDGETLIVKKYYNVGVAVDAERGLLVPVLRVLLPLLLTIRHHHIT